MRDRLRALMKKNTGFSQSRAMSDGGVSATRLALSNGTWSAVQQAAMMASNSIVGLLLIVVLPVHEFGSYTYATALSAFGLAVMSGGLASLGVKMIVNPTRSERATVAGLLLVRELLALLSIAVIAIIALSTSDAVSAAVALVAAASLLARAFDAPEIWYRAHMRTGVVAVRRLAVTLVMFGVRLIAIAFFQSLWVFIGLFVLEAVISSALVCVRYIRDRDTPGFGRPSFKVAAELMRSSWPLLVSGVANQANLRSDIIVVQAVLGASAVGVYSAAARMSELAFFIPVVFMNATLPLLLRTREEHGQSSTPYRRMLQRSYDTAFWLGVAVAVGAGGVGTFVISTFFSDAYSDSIELLWILVIACPFVFMAAVYSKWIIAEGILWASVLRHGLGALANISLNLALLPVIGVRAAAISTVVSYVTASYLACFVGRRSRAAGVQMTLAALAPIRYLRDLITRRRKTTNPRSTS